MDTEEASENEVCKPKRITQEIKHVLADWKQRAEDKAWMHEHSFRYYKRINYAMMIPIIMASTTTGTLNLVNASPRDEECNTSLNILQLSLGIVGLATAAATTIYKFIRVSENQESHDIYATQYERLAREIEVESLLSESQSKTYADMGTLLKEIQEAFDHLDQHAPNIPSIVERALEQMKQRNQGCNLQLCCI